MERISLSNSAFEGKNNTYLFADGPETVLIDTGDWMATTREQLKAGLTDHAVKFEDIDRIFLTHWHPDHTGLAGEIQAASGASVHIHAADAALLEGDSRAWTTLHDRQARYFEEWGMPEDKQEILRNRVANTGVSSEHPTVHSFEDRDAFSFNRHELTVVHAPGHAAGLCLFEMELDGQLEVFSGDALLPEYTPNVGGADVRVENALQKYLRTLQSIVDAGYERAWPGHRNPIADPAARAAYIIQHHEERAWRVLNTLREQGPCDTWTVSAELFGRLDGIHILHGPGEAHAHLEHLEQTGAAVSDGTEYRLADGVAAELTTTDERWELDY